MLAAPHVFSATKASSCLHAAVDLQCYGDCKCAKYSCCAGEKLIAFSIFTRFLPLQSWTLHVGRKEMCGETYLEEWTFRQLWTQVMNAGRSRSGGTIAKKNPHWRPMSDPAYIRSRWIDMGQRVYSWVLLIIAKTSRPGRMTNNDNEFKELNRTKSGCFCRWV